MKIRYSLVLSLAAASILPAVSGCWNTESFGKYNEEQMQQIPMASESVLPTPSGGSMVLAIVSETITSDEVLGTVEKVVKPAAAQVDSETFTEQARPYIREAIKGKITDILIYQEARKKAPENIDDALDKAVENEISRFIASYRNNYALAENKIKELGHDWRSFREYQKKLILMQSYLSDQFKDEKRYSNQQLQDYYQQHKNDFCWDGKVGFSIVDIQPQELGPEKIVSGESRQAAAMRIANDLIDQIRGGADFAELSKQYHGPLAAIGGKVETVTYGRNSLSEPYNTLETLAIGMSAGQISQPVEIDDHVFILKVDTLTLAGCYSFEEVQSQIQDILSFESRDQKYQEMISKIVMKADMAQMERFTDFCVRQAYNRWGRDSQ